MTQNPSIIFLNDKKTLVALDRTFVGHARTEIYDLVYRAKYSADETATRELVSHCLTFLTDYPYFKFVDYICAVPSEKEYDLPRSLAALLANKLSIPDVTPNLIFEGAKASARRLSVTQKRGNWRKAGIIYDGDSLKNKTMLLLDDNYQSGVTMRFIGQILKNHGLMNIFGLAMTKTWSDTDNLRKTDG